MEFAAIGTVYVIVVAVVTVGNTFSATCDFLRYEQVAVGMRQVGVAEKWMPLLGVPKVLGALGVAIGIAVPLIGIAAAGGLVLYFVGAIITHIRVWDISPSLGLATVFLTLSAAALVLRLTTM